MTTKTRFPGIGVRVRNGAVCKDEWQGKRLGALAGAHAELTGGTRPHNIGAAIITAPLSLGAGLLIGLTRRTEASAFIVFADGTLHEHKVHGKSALAAAQRDTVKFNATASAAPAPQAATPVPSDQFTIADHERARRAGQAAMERVNQRPE